MTLSELVLLIQWEVQKSCNLVDDLVESKRTDDNVNIRLGIDKFEITLPITAKERELDFRDVDKNFSDEAFRRFHYPLIVRPERDLKAEGKTETSRTKGKVLDVSIDDSLKLDSVKSEKGGSITIVMSFTRS